MSSQDPPDPIGVGPMCYVSAVLSRSMFRLFGLKTINTGQACMVAWLNSHENQTGESLDPLFCSYNSLPLVLNSLTLCEANVTDCGIDEIGKYYPLFWLQCLLENQTKQYKSALELENNLGPLCAGSPPSPTASSQAALSSVPVISTIISTPTPSPSQSSQSNIILQSASTSATAPLCTSQAATTAAQASSTASTAPSTPPYTSIQTTSTQVGHLS
jgi:hypothetical protein